MLNSGHGHQTLGKLLSRCLRGAAGIAAGIGLAAAATSALAADAHCDVVVIGAGGSGLTSALSAAEAGAKVIVVEKMPFIGGNTVLATGFMLGVPKGEPRELELLESDMIRKGGRTTDQALLTRIVSGSGEAVEWLRSYGAELEPLCITRDDSLQTACNLNEDGTVSKRGIQPKRGLIGPEIINALLHGIESHGVPIRTRTAVKRITTDAEGRVNGVVVLNTKGREYRIDAPAVVIATGGFSANEAMVSRFARHTQGLQSTNSPAATGDGILLAENMGARTVDMHAVTVHPTTLPFSGLILPHQVRVNGAILVNDKGERFADELSEKLAEQIRDKNSGRAWLIFDQAMIDDMPVLKSYARSGYFIRGTSDLELARGIRVPPEKFHETLVRYRSMVDRQEDTDFGRPQLLSRLDSSPLYAVSVRPGIHTTLGGLKIDPRARVLSDKGPIAGLYAAGEVTGGVLGARRLEGAGLTAAIVYGRIAGTEAADWAKLRAKTKPAAGTGGCGPLRRQTTQPDAASVIMVPQNPRRPFLCQSFASFTRPTGTSARDSERSTARTTSGSSSATFSNSSRSAGPMSFF